jgi:hypothetical protein
MKTIESQIQVGMRIQQISRIHQQDPFRLIRRPQPGGSFDQTAPGMTLAVTAVEVSVQGGGGEDRYGAFVLSVG